ncbi:unnamed protein product [Calicophoron daubneyi]|uniref:Tetratricopeptide repeat protein 29 n=1 Tax=Calicophoron daubneyi TaxID=300641 RepID=A0AAV2TNQ9_CALDB
MHEGHHTYIAVPMEVNNNADKIPSYSSCYGGRHAAQSLISKPIGYCAPAHGINCETVNRLQAPIECPNIGCNVSNMGPKKLVPIQCAQLNEVINDQATKLRLRSELPHLTRRDVSQYRLPFYEVLCNDLLRNGYHYAFTELFNLHKRQDDERRIAGPDSPLWFIPPLSEQPEKIKLLSFHLCQAESATRRGDKHTLFTSYLLLGLAFMESCDDLWVAEHFFLRALEVAKTITDDDGLKLATAHQHYGRLKQAKNDLEEAHKSLSEFYRLTRGKEWRDCDGHFLRKLAAKYLVDNYEKKIQATPAEYHSDRITLCKQAQEIALECEDWKVESLVWLRLGQLLEAAGNLPEGIRIYKEYFDKSAAKEDYISLGKACEALAKLCQRQGKIPESILYLQKFASICERNGQWVQLGRACQMLGEAFDAVGDYASALKWMRKAYTLPNMIQGLKPEHCRQTTEASRIMIGISRAHLMNTAYTKTVLTNTPPSTLKIIDWKAYPMNEEKLFLQEEIKLPPIRLGEQKPARDVISYALHPSTGFLYH